MMETAEYLVHKEEGKEVLVGGAGDCEKPDCTGVGLGGREETYPSAHCDSSEHGYVEDSGFCLTEGAQERLGEYVDLDLDTLSYKLEEQHQGMKRALVAFFVETKGKLKEKGMQDLAVSRAKHERALNTKQEEVWILEKEVAAAKKNVKSLYSTLSLFADVRCN